MIHSGYSFKLCVGHLKDVADRIKEIGWSCAPIADRCSTYSFVSWSKQCQRAGLRPVYGVELAVVPEQELEKKQSPDFWVFLARDRLSDLHQAIAAATLKERKSPCLTYQEALSLPGLVKIAGPRSRMVEPAQDLYWGLSPALPAGLYRRAREAGHAFIAAPCNSYPRASDKEFYRVAVGPKRQETQTYPQHILSDEEWSRSISWFTTEDDRRAALNTRQQALDTCRAELVKAELLSPARSKSLRQLCLEGAVRTGIDLSLPVYRARLDRELAMIEEKNFADYFYILHELVSWSKQRMVVGPARGSSCGSLVCYLLDITAIDPIPFDLVFERFIDVNRADLPDVDIDFSDKLRDEMFAHMEDLYGKDHVARLGTVGTYQPKSAMNQCAISLRVPQGAVDDVANVMIQRAQGDSRAESTLEDTLTSTNPGKALLTRYPEMFISTRLQDHPANAGQHAAGVVVTKRPVKDHVAVNSKTGATMCDKYDAEHLNLLKIDALGLTQLSVFERVLQLIGVEDPAHWNQKLCSIPLADPLAFKVLNDGHYAGVFQFAAGSALANLVNEMRRLRPNPIESLDDMTALTALVRPGPMVSGGTHEWMNRRLGRTPTVYEHPLLEPYVRNTFGVCVYQEQILQIGRELGGLSWEDVTELRKAMSKSLGQEYFNRYGDRWKAGAVAKGLPQDVADNFWRVMCGHGSWAFNKAHSVAYAMVSYWSCWLKAHHPVEYAAATLDANPKPEDQVMVLRELAREGITYTPVDRELSTDRWEIAHKAGTRVLIGPLSNVKHIGPVGVNKIMMYRRSKLKLPPGLDKLLAAGRTEIDSLYPVRDAVSRIDLGMSGKKILSPITRIGDIEVGKTNGVVVLGVITRIFPRDKNDTASVAKRKGQVLSGPTLVLNMYIQDDSGSIMGHIERYSYARLAHIVMEHGRIGKAIWAIKGYVPDSFKMIYIEQVRCIGDMDDRWKPQEPAEAAPATLSLAVN